MAVLDTVAIASLGVYSELYGLGEKSNIATLYVSFGLLESVPRESGILRHRMPAMVAMPTMPTFKI